ncbi:MAG: NAD(+) synthase, partial [Myxococcales bacterium]|nr:NAD(+) synthase [Myxococcales bacterium]
MLRARRGFRAGPWLTAKAALINDYCRASGLRACVVGVSGGVDSAVVLGLLRHASRQPGSPLRRLVAALLPLRIAEGVTGQTTATARGRLAAEAFAAERVEIGLAPAYEAMRQAAEAGLGVRGGAWAAGQLASNIRAPALYYLATLLTQAGAPAIVCGTTNRDEGGYIGFFGKASDGMVDLQPLADLHKREVFELARALDVPAEIREATPTGDTFDGRVDEEMIGAPYDFVELFQLLRAQLDDDARARALA